MEIIKLAYNMRNWNEVINYADKCSWGGGKSLAGEMQNKRILDFGSGKGNYIRK